MGSTFARLGLGVALLPMPFAFAPIASGELIRLLPAKTRVFVDFVASASARPASPDSSARGRPMPSPGSIAMTSSEHPPLEPGGSQS
jgi:DNA-binding transcriptional LysR family regulator